jgi:hypothetical protein
MTRAILCVVERFALGILFIALLICTLGGMAAGLSVCGKLLLNRMYPENWRLSRNARESLHAVGAIALAVGLGGLVVMGCYFIGEDIAHSLGLCRMEKAGK